ncbi:MAG: hypothetical protein Q7R41_14740 [Phycisphaerales bacterium]|jgi:hypothetical protein|nr:hypothetical protein [Phycisphaerales bacterium]
MRPSDIIQHVRKQPFQPVRVFISDGSSYDIRHPEMMMVGRTEVVIGLLTDGNDVYDRFAYCDPVHITRIEPINGKTLRRRTKRSR